MNSKAELPTSSYLQLFTPHHIALFDDWLTENHELYVDVYLPHSGSSSTGYFVRSIQDLKILISRQTHPELSITVFRRPQFSLRGIADKNLLEQALNNIPDGEWYRIVSLDSFPSECNILGSGNRHQELETEFSEIVGQNVGIGQSPFDVFDASRPKWNAADVFQLSVTKNRNYYENYAANSEKYRRVEELWYGQSLP
jgi:hypothetical protein